MNKFAKVAVAAAIAGTALVAQANVVIDDFSTGQTKMVDTLANGTGLTSSTAAGSTGVFGGQRDLFVEKKLGNGNTNGVSVGVDPNGSLTNTGLLSFSSDNNQTGYAAVRWDGGAGAGFGETGSSFASFLLADNKNLGGGTGYNFFNDGDRFTLTVETADFGFLFQLIALDFLGNTSKLTLVAGANGADHTIPFALFSNAFDYTLPNFGRLEQSTPGAIDFTQIVSLTAIINVPDTAPQICNTAVAPFPASCGTTGRVALDLGITSANVVPEPGSLALFSVALLMLGASVRRKQS